MASGAPYVDLSRMTQLIRCAVAVRDPADLDIFYRNAKSQLGRMFNWSRSSLRDFWNVYESRTSFTLYDVTDRIGSMTYCDEEWFHNNGYEVIEFSDLAYPTEIEDSGIPLSVLFGGTIDEPD